MVRAIVGIIGNDAGHTAELEAALNRSGLAPLAFRSLQDFRRRNGGHSVDLLLLDWHLSESSGVTLLQSLRTEDALQAPVIVIASEDQDDDLVDALQAGADDYLLKPLNRAELIARILAVLRRARQSRAPVEVYPPYEFLVNERKLFVQGVEVATTPKEFDLMLFMFRRATRIISREAILSYVWRTRSSLPTRTIDTYVSRLRNRFGLDGQSGWELRGIYRQGYCLVPGHGPTGRRASVGAKRAQQAKEA